jgi:hypothetical protein
MGRATDPWRLLFVRQHILWSRWMTGKSKHVTRMDAHGRHVVTALQFDSEYIVTCSDDCNVKVPRPVHLGGGAMMRGVCVGVYVAYAYVCMCACVFACMHVPVPRCV